MQQPPDIYMDSKQRRAFTRRAILAFKRDQEYMEAIFYRRGVGEFHVIKFIKLRLKGERDDFVDCDEVQYQALKNEARNTGLEFGTVHSHIYGDSSPSEWDHRESVKENETLLGVCFIWKDEKTERIKTRIDFWQPQLPFKLKVIPSR